MADKEEMSISVSGGTLSGGGKACSDLRCRGKAPAEEGKPYAAGTDQCTTYYISRYRLTKGRDCAGDR